MRVYLPAPPNWSTWSRTARVGPASSAPMQHPSESNTRSLSWLRVSSERSLYATWSANVANSSMYVMCCLRCYVGIGCQQHGQLSCQWFTHRRGAENAEDQ